MPELAWGQQDRAFPGSNSKRIHIVLRRRLPLKAGSATGGLRPQHPPSMEGAPETRALASLSIDEDTAGKAVPNTASEDKARDAAEGRKLLLQYVGAHLIAADSGDETEAGSATGGLHPQRPPSMEGAPETRALASLSVDEDPAGMAVPGTASEDMARDAAEEKLLLQYVGALLIAIAADSGDETEVRQLVACGADVNTANENGYTPLHHAAYGGHAAVVQQLLAAGADGAAEDEEGTTPRSIAQGRGGEVLAMFVAAEEKAQRLRSTAFAMGLQERLGAASAMRELDPELLRMVVELVYPPVDNVLEAEGEINSDSDSEVDEEGGSDEEEGGGEEEGEGDEEEGGSGEEEAEGGGMDA
ncbi:hypothetical protein T484DRAFT_1778803 [Baffinella frigidus]|nr:hypothetical protein T484DRAFT_1778803 [Cryptophyta sp. CCMP2293]